MFGFSLTKLLVLALVVGAVIVGYRVLGRLANNQGDSGGKSGDKARRDGASAAGAFDTEYDPETDTYVVRGSESERD